MNHVLPLMGLFLLCLVIILIAKYTIQSAHASKRHVFQVIEILLLVMLWKFGAILLVNKLAVFKNDWPIFIAVSVFSVVTLLIGQNRFWVISK